MSTLEDYMKLNYKYSVDVLEDEGEEYIKAYIPDLPGLVVYVDDDSEIRSELEEAKKAWFLGRIRSGKSIPLPKIKKEKSGRVTLRMPKTMHAQLDYLAEEDGVSLNDYIVRTIDKGLQNSSTYEVKEHLETIENSTDDIKKELQFNAFGSVSQDKIIALGNSLIEKSSENNIEIDFPRTKEEILYEK
ncbi:hypothetical protein RD055328_08490 [Companilactobacillus sp. RD055328]|uniref:toxin-antitoxin system HicB family antitoxin n=1 Tax=Companilactobacillus sp. RD055328 TaxID=2916634 RepID=UPI001FC7D836|nr:toxin-antitoxin system HicB family antitoxin [Companilactobacillus sp. RD055328]GKQ42926.1 hypothetical protein RD055328_08490 [Companilactobacillus sp. RD055328]